MRYWNDGPSRNIKKKVDVSLITMYFDNSSHTTLFGGFGGGGVKKHLPNPRKHYIRSVIIKKKREREREKRLVYVHLSPHFCCFTRKHKIIRTYLKQDIETCSTCTVLSSFVLL